ncbi:hypothetical protein PG985_010012 [Apiospora marii]|uniref:Uncharacterized protein n=1 Tax=Apiospora marii TaxID=335849 RepID=A0ABR1RKR0_9PEZI
MWAWMVRVPQPTTDKRRHHPALTHTPLDDRNQRKEYIVRDDTQIVLQCPANPHTTLRYPISANGSRPSLVLGRVPKRTLAGARQPVLRRMGSTVIHDDVRTWDLPKLRLPYRDILAPTYYSP